MSRHILSRFRPASLFAFVCTFAAFTALSYAQTPAPAAAAVPAVVAAAAEIPAATATAPAPVQPVPSPVAPVAEQSPAIVRRKEDEPGAEQPPAQNKGPSIFDRAAAYMKGKDGLAGEISALRTERDNLTAQLAETNRTISALNTELSELRAGKASLEKAVNDMEAQRTTVAAEVAAIGFPAASLPKVAPVESAADGADGLLAQFRAETDIAKRAELAAQLREKQRAAASKN